MLLDIILQYWLITTVIIDFASHSKGLIHNTVLCIIVYTVYQESIIILLLFYYELLCIYTALTIIGLLHITKGKLYRHITDKPFKRANRYITVLCIVVYCMYMYTQPFNWVNIYNRE